MSDSAPGEHTPGLQGMRADRAAGGRMILLAYAAAGGAALLTGFWQHAEHPIAIALWADLVATVMIFAFSLAFRNASFYDAYWSVAPIAIAAYWWFCGTAAEGGGDLARQVAAFALVTAWGVRLTHNWWRGWTGLDHEDWRYVDLRAKTGRAYFAVNLGGIHVFPTLQVFLGCLALYPAMTIGSRPFGWIDALAIAVTGGAIAIETVADLQKLRFIRSSPAPGDVLTTGLWGRSRHPNYLGEIGFWWGLWLFALAADPSWWWTVVGPIAINVMFLAASLPMIENRMLERRPHYDTVVKNIPRLVPRLRG